MTSRLDRLLLLLDTGSSPSVRNTAAKQLAQLAAKSVISDIPVEDDIKSSSRLHATVGDSSAWSELLAVVARILPYLHSKSHDTRTTATNALSQIFSSVPIWRPQDDDVKPPPDLPSNPPEFPTFSVQELMQKGALLLASSGKEFAKPSKLLSNPAEVQRARREAMGRLGLDFLDSVGAADDMDLDRELAADTDSETVGDHEVTKIETPVAESHMDADSVHKEPSPPARSHSVSPAMPSPVTPSTPANGSDLEGLSARERNRLKRKRKAGNSAFVTAPPPANVGTRYAAAPAGSSSKARLLSAEASDMPKSRLDSPNPMTKGSAPDKVVIDPSKGGAVSPKSAQQNHALEVPSGCWVWGGIVSILEVDLFSPAWETRHGAAMALRELLKTQGISGGMKDMVSVEENTRAHEDWCNHLAAKLLCVFVLDRFGDFVSDQVVAPVRETVSQTLASLLLHMPLRSVVHVHSILLQMIRQDFPLPSKAKSGKVDERNHVWEVRHAGLLGIKYEVAVRSDLFCAPEREGEYDVGKSILQGVVDAAVLG